MLPYLWHYKWRVMAALAFMVGAKLANVGVPLLLKELVDAMTPQPSVSQAVLVVPAALLVAYGVLRLSVSAFTELRELVFALGAALFIGNLLALVRRRRDTEAARSEALARNRPGSPVRGNRRTGPGDDLVRAPGGRTLAYAVIGFVVMVAGLGAIVNN